MRIYGLESKILNYTELCQIPMPILKLEFYNVELC